MEFIFLIILCFFLGMLIYSLMKKFCGCNLVEGNDHICSGSYSASMCSELSASFCEGYYYSASGSASGVYCKVNPGVMFLGTQGQPTCGDSASYCSTTPASTTTGPSASMCSGSLVNASGILNWEGTNIYINASGCGYVMSGSGVYGMIDNPINCDNSFVYNSDSGRYNQCRTNGNYCYHDSSQECIRYR